MVNKKILEKELTEIYNENFRKLYRFFYYKTFDHASAEDLTQETFLNFAEFISKGNKVENKKAFLFAIAKNVFAKNLRRKYEEVNLDLETIDFYSFVEDTLEQNGAEDNFMQFVKSFISQLPNKQRIILELRFINKMKIKHIAEELGKNINYVKTTQRRGLKNLKKLLQASTPG